MNAEAPAWVTSAPRLFGKEAQETALRPWPIQFTYENWVYVAVCGDGVAVKFGVSTNLPRRLREFENNSPFQFWFLRAWCCGRGRAFSVERWLMSTYADARIRGEWFSPRESMQTVEIPVDHEHFADADVRKKVPERGALLCADLGLPELEKS